MMMSEVPEIHPVVEGYGEVEAVRVLLPRVLDHLGEQHVPIGPPIRHPRSKLVTKEGIEKVVGIAKRRPRCGAVLIIFDADDDCPRTLGPQLRLWAEQAAGSTVVGLILARSEYESWFLASIESIRGKRGVSPTAPVVPDPESIRDAKGWLSRQMPALHPYKETTDQPALSAEINIKSALSRSRSFRKLVKEVEQVARNMNIPRSPA